MMWALLLLGMQLQLGPAERLPQGIQQCQRHIDAQSALRLARVNSHLARTVSEKVGISAGLSFGSSNTKPMGGVGVSVRLGR